MSRAESIAELRRATSSGLAATLELVVSENPGMAVAFPGQRYRVSWLVFRERLVEE